MKIIEIVIVVAILIVVSLVTTTLTTNLRTVHVKLEVQRVGMCGETSMGNQVCDILFTNGSIKRIARGPQPSDSVWVTIPVEEAPQ
jgi:hypothetical protein